MKLRAFFIAALCLALSAPAFAETQNVKVSGSLDAYWFYRSNFDLRDNNGIGNTPAGTADYTGTSATTNNRSEGDDFFMSIVQLQVAADLTDNVSTVINLVNQRDWNADTFGAAGTSASTAENSANEFDLVLDLAYVQMKEIFYSPLTLTIGRQDIVIGRGFVVGWNPQDPQGMTQADEFTALQAFDAIRATLDFNPWTIDLIYSKILENAHNSEDDRDLYIANVNYKFAEYNAVAEAYYMHEADKATLSGTSGTKDNETQIVGGRVQFDPISQITLGGELAYQFGSYRASVTAPERDRGAWGADLFAEYRFDYNWSPMLGIQYVYLSGEEDLGSATSADYGAWNGAFRGPTYGWIHDYLEGFFGTAQANDPAAGQNQQHISLYGTLKPMEDLQLWANYYHFWTTDDVHATAGVQTSATLSDDLGDEIDLGVNYDYTEDVTFGIMANWFIPGELYSSPNDETASQVVSSVKVTF